MTKRKTARKSAAEKKLEEKKACVANLETSVNDLKRLKRFRKTWAKTLVRGKPVQLSDYRYRVYFDDFDLGTPIINVWNALAKANPAACQAFHKAGEMLIAQSIARCEKEQKLLVKRAC